MVNGTFPAPRSPFNLYDFVNDDDRPVLVDRGILPWWSHPRLTIRFFRPLSSTLRWAEHRLLHAGPEGALAFHLHSFLWWFAAVLAARAFFRRRFSPRVCLVATFVFALAPCHAIPLAWLANREALLSLALGTLGLTSYVLWREGGRLAHFAAATALFALAIAGGEYALGFGGYVVAYEMLRDGDKPLRRALGVLPFALPVAVYLAIRSALHYGTVGSGYYSDPLQDPKAFLASAPWRAVALVADGWLTLDPDTWGPTTAPSNGLRWTAVLIVAAAVPILVMMVRRALAKRSDDERRTVSWLVLGSMLSLLPVLAVVPSARLLGVSMLGVAPVVGLVLDDAWFPAVIPPRTRAAELLGIFAVLLGFGHLVHGPATAWLRAREMRRSAVEFADHVAWLRDRVGDPGHADVVVLRGNAGQFFGPFALDEQGLLPSHWRILAHTGHVLLLRRSQRSLEILVPKGKTVFPTGPGNLFRDEGSPLKKGDEVSVRGMHAKVLDTGDHGPTDVRFVFDRDLDSSSLVWITEDFDGFHDATLPAIGFGKPFDP